MSASPLPSFPVAIKLASIAVHADEVTSPGAHELDVATIKSLLSDPEVTEYLETLRGMALLPVKRSE